MTDAHLMDAGCIHGTTWYDCDTCTSQTEDPASFKYQLDEANRSIRQLLDMLDDTHRKVDQLRAFINNHHLRYDDTRQQSIDALVRDGISRDFAEWIVL